jgi:RNA polymerase sigma-70 factor (ECF subfamily)
MMRSIAQIASRQLEAAYDETAPQPAASSSRAAPVIDEEAALVRAAQRGDRQAFSQLVERHQRAVYGFLRARLTDSSDADDLCQEVFLRCYLGRTKLDRAVAVGPWLTGIARNILREHVRRLSRRREVAWTELCLELDQLTQTGDGGEHDAIAHLPKCLDALGQSAREAIELRYRAQLRMDEIGVRLKRSEGAVKLLVHRARHALRNCLERKLLPGASDA